MSKLWKEIGVKKMKTEDMMRELENVARKYDDKPVFTGEVNIPMMCREVAKRLEELSQPKTDWIPFEQREADEEEKAHFLEHYGYEFEYMLCGRLPDEDEEILVTYSNGCVGEDIFLRDGTECYLDSGQEIVTEAIAWMPKPQPYKKEGAENE